MKTIVIIHSYCLTADRCGLTAMSRVAVETALQISQREDVSDIIVSAAYSTWKKEAALKEQILAASTPRVHVLGPIVNSYDEAREGVEIALERGANRLIIVAEKWHGPRALKAYRDLHPRLELELRSFECVQFERAYEPSWIKSVRSGSRPLWILWNVGLRYIPTWILKKL